MYSKLLLLQAQEDCDQAKRIYEELNNELHTELPEFYNRYGLQLVMVT